MSKKNQLMEVFADAMAVHNDYIAVAIETKGSTGVEVIINPSCNFKTKMEYYQKSYDDDLILKTFEGICIVGACSFDEHCEWDDMTLWKCYQNRCKINI